jgi:uncharacterized membrane protein
VNTPAHSPSEDNPSGDSPCEAAAAAARSWQMRRNCCLGPWALLAAAGAAPALAAVISLGFLAAGYPLIALFAILQALGVAAAVLAYGRHAVDREDVMLRDGRLMLTVREGRRCCRLEWSVHCLRLLPPRDGDPLVALQAGGQRHRLGRHLCPAHRTRFAAELAQALRHERAAFPLFGDTRHAV